MKMLRNLVTLLPLLLLCLARPLAAALLNTSVKYVSADAVYLDAGRSIGVAVGDSVEIFRDGDLVTALRIAFVSDNSASCGLTGAAPRIQIGDAAVIHVAEAIFVESPPPDTKPRERSEITAAQSRAGRASFRKNRLTGRIGMEYTMQDDREEFNYDYTQPSLRLRAKLSRIGGSHYTASVRMRVRKTFRDRETTAATTSRSSSRIYEAALRYENPDSRVEFGGGRLLARELRGIGYLDGVYARYRMNSHVSTGLFGGTEPDLENTDFQTDVVKGGVYAAYKNRTGNGDRLAATLSFAGAYQEGEIDREFIYQQISFTHAARFRIYQSAELNLYRGWLSDAENSTLELSSLLLNAHYAVSRSIAMSFSYDNRTNFHTYESRSVPDSLFDDALRQGWRGSVDLKLTPRVSGSAGAGLRATAGDAEDTRSGWLRLSVSNFLQSGIHASARVRAYRSAYSGGYQPSLRISRSLLRELRAAFEAGVNSYDLRLSDERIEQHWFRLMLDASLGRRIYLSFDAEAARGSSRDANLITLSLGYRL